jgi:hypothetical protein
MIAHIDMLSVWAESWKFGKFKFTKIVFKDFARHVGLYIDNFKFIFPHFLDAFHEGNDVMKGHRHGMYSALVMKV